LATFAIGCVLPLTPGLRQLEDRSEDLRFHWRGARNSKAKVVTVVIDAEAESVWDEPRAFWGSRLAKLVTKCNEFGARRIGIDMVITPNVDSYLLGLNARWRRETLGERAGQDELGTEGSLELPNADLEAAISRAKGRVVLATITGGDTDFNVELAAAPNLGYAGVEGVHRDVVREVPAGVMLESAWLRSFAWVMADREPPSRVPLRINYSGADQPSIPANRLLTGKFDAALLKDAYVIIGEHHRAVQDLHDTPYVPLMAGVNIQAETLRTILDDVPLKRTPDIASCLISGLVAGVGFAAAWKLSLSRFLIALLLFLGVWLILAQFLFGRNIVLPVAAPILLAAVAVPILAFPEKAVRNELKFRQQRAQFGQMISDSMVRRLELRRAAGVGLMEDIEAALLFMDIEGFSSKSNRLSSEDVVSNLNELLELAIRAVEEKSGYVLTFSGDGFSAIFESSSEEGEPRRRAIEAAEALLGYIRQWNDNSTATTDPWNVRVGLAFGTVSVALVGTRGRHTISTYGTAMNLASRLEQMGKELKSRIVTSKEFAEVLPEGYSQVFLAIKGEGWESPYPAFAKSPEGQSGPESPPS